MPIDDFSSDTFVAFTDIAGFKAMMHDGKRGAVALDVLYSEGYKIIGKQPECGCRVEGFFVSDCGVLFVREFESAAGRLEALLNAVERLNRACFERAVSLTTSIAWGEFSYKQRIEISGIEKNPIYGNAYVSAFIDNETDIPKLYPNECRILKHKLPQDGVDLCSNRQGPIGSRTRKTAKHFYFEWMRSPKNGRNPMGKSVNL